MFVYAAMISRIRHAIVTTLQISRLLTRSVGMPGNVIETREQAGDFKEW
jgi:hypothetical protein